MLSCEEINNKRPTQQQQSTLFFTPRQVILSNPTMKQQQQQQQQKQQLTSDQRVLLYHSISHFLQLNGFLKSLSKFRKETHLEKDSWMSCSLNLEEIFQEYLLKRDDKANVSIDKQKDGDVSAEIVKGAKENKANGGKKSITDLENNAVNGDEVKSKMKKKKKESKDIESSKHLNGETNLKENDHPAEEVKKSKDKKKKQKDGSEPLDKELQENQAEAAADQPSEKVNAVPQKDKSKSKKSKEKTSVEKDEAEKEKKSSKKRKKSSSDDNDNDHAEEAQTDVSKRRKTDDSAQANGTEQALKTPNEFANGVLENGSAKKSEKSNKTKERNDSAQPKSANAFRRVKPDEVEFADERLQDNSYWAKDGADSGYGAKAQEVLGQVRGRDFRHEKTKKKRGSYRGGQIDLQSHSIKFNYDDDE